jgi:hypothetical protein
MTEAQQPNIAIHLSRHYKFIFLSGHSLRPGDGERWTDWVSNKPQQVEFADILMSKNSQLITNWAIQHTCHV